MDTSKQMPDLMGTAHGASDGNRRILAHLEHGPRAPVRAARAWDFDGWTVGLVLLLLTMCGIAWLMHEETITPVTFKSQRSSARYEAAHAPAIPAAQAARPADAQAAAIINMPHVVTLAAPPAQPTQLAQQPSRAAAAPRTVMEKVASHRPANAPRPRPGVETETAMPAPAGDTDVTLLTALVAHAGQPARVAPERTRDVVERRDGDRTADLLLRCKQLGLMEGMLCRSRICSGSWESDAACRAPAN